MEGSHKIDSFKHAKFEYQEAVWHASTSTLICQGRREEALFNIPIKKWPGTKNITKSLGQHHDVGMSDAGKFEFTTDLGDIL